METSANTSPAPARSAPAAFVAGALIGALGGLIGLGGAEFRLPLLIGLFRFSALETAIFNEAMSLVDVATALPFRAATLPFAAIGDNWPIVLNLLAVILLVSAVKGLATRLMKRTQAEGFAGGRSDDLPAGAQKEACPPPPTGVSIARREKRPLPLIRSVAE